MSTRSRSSNCEWWIIWIALLFSIETGLLATNELPLPEAQNDDNSADKACSTSVFSHSSIAEDPEEEDNPSASTTPAPELPPPAAHENPQSRSKPDKKLYKWRIDLSKSEKYWSGWFENLSSKFLDLHVPKLLLLASIDGLDRALTVGQMQGKFQLQVLARCGHAVHEVIISTNFWFLDSKSSGIFHDWFFQDRPHEVAEVIAGYMIRNRFAEAIGDFTSHADCC